jgi:hypothetical protein
MPEDESPDEPEQSDHGEQLDDEERSDHEEQPDAPWPAVAYRGIIVIAVGFGVIAVAVGTIGLYTVLTGGTNGDGGADVLGEFECAEFDGDPEVGHEASYAIDSTIRSGQAIESFNASANESGVVVELRVVGELLNASARTADGTPVSVEQKNSTVRVTRSGTAPFRLWVDSLSQSTVRTVLDICPPE